MKAFTKKSARRRNEKALRTIPHKQRVLFACDVARLVLPIYENENPKDRRPRKVIELSEKCISGQTASIQVISATNALWCAVTEDTSTFKDVLESAAWAGNAVTWAENGAWMPITNRMEAVCAESAAYAALSANPKILSTIRNLFLQAQPIDIPQSPLLKSIANTIVQTRNFQEYNIILDNLEEFHNITLPRITPLGLSHYVLYTLTNTH